MKNDQSICAAAAVRMTLRHPFWTEVFYSMTVREATATHPLVRGKPIPTLATNGRDLWVNPTYYGKLPLEQQVGVLVHELFHKIFLHCSRRGGRDPKLWNIACDLAINPLILKDGHKLPPGGLVDPQYDGWSAERIYADLVKRQKAGEKFPDPDGDIIEFEGTPEEAERFESEVKAMVDRAIASAKAMGKLPAGIEAGTVQAFKPAREPWYNHLHRYMQSLSTSNYNWARLNRRTLRSHGMFTPLHISEALGPVRVYIDTSGSCYERAQQANFAGHLNAILAEARPRSVALRYFDTKVYPGEDIEAGTMEVETRPRGGGGTSFVEIFDDVEESGEVPEVVIILTDLMGRFPGIEPDYPVVWASIYEDAVAPFGETIYVDA